MARRSAFLADSFHKFMGCETQLLFKRPKSERDEAGFGGETQSCRSMISLTSGALHGCETPSSSESRLQSQHTATSVAGTARPMTGHSRPWHDALAAQSGGHHRCGYHSVGRHRSAGSAEADGTSTQPSLPSENASPSSSSRGGSVPVSQNSAPTVVGVTTLQSGSGFKKTFFKRHLPSPPATAFASPQGNRSK